MIGLGAEYDYLHVRQGTSERASPLAWAVPPVKGGVVWPGGLQREQLPLLVMYEYSMYLKPGGSLDQLFPLTYFQDLAGLNLE